ncbi:MAG: UDP-N-acetylglucosamine 2-epimerase [Promethearchaeota archaeon]
MTKRKICVFIGSRGNYLILNSILREIVKSDKLELKLIVGASAVLDKYGEIVRLIENDGYIPDEKLYMIIEGETPLTMAKSTGLGLADLSEILYKFKPDFTINVADRFEMLAYAIASSYNNIPIVHIQGGEVSGSIDESIRHAITKLSHIHFPANELSKKRLLQMGEDERYVFNYGCPRIDTVKEILENNCNVNEINKYIRRAGVGDLFNIDHDFLLVSQHPVTTEYELAREHISHTIRAVYEISHEHDLPVVFLWPNSDAGSDEIAKGIRIFRESAFPWQDPDEKHDENFRFFKFLPFEYYIWLMNKTLCLIGNSSSGIREGAYIGTPVVNVGSRQDNRARGKNVIDTDPNYKDIKKSIEKQIEHGKYESEHIYGDGNTAEKIIKVLETIEVNVQKKFITRNFY